MGSLGDTMEEPVLSPMGSFILIGLATLIFLPIVLICSYAIASYEPHKKVEVQTTIQLKK